MSSPHRKGIVQLDGISYKVNKASSKAAVIESPAVARHVQIPTTITDANQNVFTVTEISHTAFEGAKIRTIQFSPDSEVSVIGPNCFGLGSNSTVETIELPPKITVLRDDWCFNTPRVKTIKLSSKNETFILTDNDNNKIESDENDDSATGSINQGCILYNSDKTVLHFVCRDVKQLVIPNTVKRIAASACQFAQLEELVFEEGSQLEEIERSAFFGCKLTILNIPKSVRSIGDFAFNSNRHLTKVVFEEGNEIQYIGVGAFASCGLRGRDCFVCPSTQIGKLGNGCFENNKKLIYVVFENARFLEIGVNSFRDTSKNPVSGIIMGSKTRLRGKGVPTNKIILNEGETVADVKDIYKSEIGKGGDEEEEEEEAEDKELGGQQETTNDENVKTEIEIDLKEEEEDDDEIEKALVSLEDDGEDINLLEIKSRDADILIENNEEEEEEFDLDQLDKDQQIEKLKRIIKEKDQQNKQLLKKLAKMKKIIFLLNKEVST